MANYGTGKTGLGWKILSLVLALIIIAGVITGVVFWQKGNIVFNPVGQEQPADENGETASGGAVIGEGEGNGIKMMSAKIATADYDEYGISPMAETAYTIVATITPSNATNKTVDWFVDFDESLSEWAVGKNATDYVTVTPTSDGALSATVQCLQPFGEQIVIKVVSRSDDQITARCSVDYVKKISSISVNFSGADSFTLGTKYTPVLAPVYTDGTLDGTLKIADVDVQLTEGFKSYIEEHYTGGSWSRISYKANVTNKGFGSDGAFQDFSVGGVTGSRPNVAFITVSGSGVVNDLIKSAFDNAFVDAAENYSGADATLTVSYEYSYGSDQISSGETTCNIQFDTSALVVHVTEIDLNYDNVIF